MGEDDKSVDVQSLIQVVKVLNKKQLSLITKKINISDFFVLGAIYMLEKRTKEENLRLSDISNEKRLSHMGATAISRSLRLLESKDYIKRKKSEKDKRVTYVMLTEMGRNLVKENDIIVRKVWMRVFDIFGQERSKALIKELNILTEILCNEVEKETAVHTD